MKEQIQELQSLFITSILSGNYEITDADKSNVNPNTSLFLTLKLEGFSLRFHLWKSGTDESVSVSQSQEYSTTQTFGLGELSKDLQSELYKTLFPSAIKYLKEVSIKAKQEELAKLSSEIESINNL